MSSKDTGKKNGGQSVHNGKQSTNSANSPGSNGVVTASQIGPAFIPPYTGLQYPFMPPFQIPGMAGFPGFSTSTSSIPSGLQTHTYSHENPNVNSSETMFDLMRQITTSIQSMDNRLQSIEQNVDKIAKIEQNIAHLKVDVQKLTEENKSMSDRINHTENSCSYISGISDELLQSKNETEEAMRKINETNKTLQSRIHELEHKNTNLESKYTDMNNKYLDTQCDVMKNNLIVFGVNEARRDFNQDPKLPKIPSEIPEVTLRKTLKDNIQNNDDINNEVPINVDSIKFSQVKRIGDPVKAAELYRTRPLVATFESFTDRESVRKAGILLNKSQKQIKIHEHFPREVEDRRKKLYYPARKLSELDQKVVLVKDRLYINNKLFDPETYRYTDKFGDNQYLSKPPPPAYGAEQNRYRQPPRNHYERPPSTSVTGLDNAQENSNARNIAGYKPRIQNRKRVDTTQPLDFTTPNRYQLIAELDRSDQYKRKDCSPIDTELSSKRVDDSSSPNSNAKLFYNSELEKSVALVSLVSDDMMSNPFVEHMPVITPAAPQSGEV